MISSTMHFLNGTLDDDGDENIVPTSILCAGCVCVLYATIDEMKKKCRIVYTVETDLRRERVNEEE